jgi:hypothetical protein
MFKLTLKIKVFATAAFLFLAIISAAAGVSYATTPCGDGKDGHGQYTPSIDLGCQARGNPILDMTFGIVRFLSDGVGLVIVGSLIVGGIQYTTSRGDPQATAKAMGRIQSTIIALLIFIFSYAILNYIIPSGFFQ